MTKRFSTFYIKKYFPFEIVCLLLVVIAGYFGTLDHSFHFDDKGNIWNNHFIQISNISISELKSAAFDSLNHDRPVANISFALNYYFHGLEVKGYHIVNIVVHLLAGIMLFYFVKTTLDIPLVRKKYGEPGVIPLFTSLIWLAHPLHIQSVTYIVQRMNSMAAMFFIMAMLFYVKGRLTPEKVKKVLFFAISFIAGLLAVGTKQNTATLPLFIFLYEWYFFQDLRLKFSRQQLLWIAAIGCLFVFVLYLFLGSSPLNRLFPSYADRPFSMAERVLTQPRVVLHYISLIFYPEPGRLNLDYDFPLSYSLVSPPTTLLAILAIIGMLGLAIYSAKNNRLYSFCIWWFLGNLVIESSTIPLEIIFEHRTYLPSMMVILLLVLFLHQTVRKRRALIACLVAVALLFSYWTYERNKIWKDELTFWTDNHKKSPNKARVNLHLGVTLSNANRVDEAIPILEKALRLYEKEIETQKRLSSYKMYIINFNLGINYIERGEYQKAIFYLNRSLGHFYFSVSAHYAIGLCYTQIGRFEESINHLTKAMEFTKHHRKQDSGFSNVAQIEQSLNFAKMELKRQKDRE
jgi:tetratricopeptide (TPR) repeat protein